MSAAPEIEAVRAKAAGSSFYTAMKLLPQARREGMYAIYAFCRAVDDIADDGEGSREERIAELNDWREDLKALYAGAHGGRAAFLKEVVETYAPRLGDFFAVIDGMQMDLEGDIVAPSLDELDLYCDRVASAVGRLSIKVFGMEEAPGFQLSHHLGRALQLTNILRDLDEDEKIGRLYLPRDFLGTLGPVNPQDVLSRPEIDGPCRRLAALARTHYAEAQALMASRPVGDLRAPRLMGAAYAEILKRMERQGWAPPRRRVKVPKPLLAWLALRYGLTT